MWPCVIENHGTSYTTPPLSADTHIAGHPIADLWIESTQPDADVFVYLSDISPSGETKILTHGRLRASFRAEQSPPFKNFMGLPYHRGNREDVKPLEPGKAARMRLDLLPTSAIVKRGHRLQVTIAGADPRQRSRTVQFDPPPTITVFSGREGGSSVSLPVVTDLVF
jgi:hypothetical protein